MILSRLPIQQFTALYVGGEHLYLEEYTFTTMYLRSTVSITMWEGNTYTWRKTHPLQCTCVPLSPSPCGRGTPTPGGIHIHYNVLPTFYCLHHHVGEEHLYLEEYTSATMYLRSTVSITMWEGNTYTWRKTHPLQCVTHLLLSPSPCGRGTPTPGGKHIHYNVLPTFYCLHHHVGEEHIHLEKYTSTTMCYPPSTVSITMWERNTYTWRNTHPLQCVTHLLLSPSPCGRGTHTPGEIHIHYIVSPTLYFL